MTIGERIKEIRKELNLNQTDFGAAIGLKQTAIGMYENNQRAVGDRTILSICKEYNINPDWLRDGIGKMFVDPATFSLDEYARANKLTETEVSIVRGFMELDPSVRSAIYNIFRNAFSMDRSAYDSAPASSRELEKIFPPIGDDDVDANIG